MYKNIVRTVYKVSDFLSWFRNDSLKLSPSFQRRPVWLPPAKSFLIDTVIQGLPMPIIFLREQTNLETLEPVREVVDGQQRLRTLISYISPNLLKDFNPKFDDFTVLKTHNESIAGKRFPELTPNERKRILDYEFSVHVLPSETEDREVLQIFARMNSTGVKLSPQEIRNAEYLGVFKKLVYRLAYEQLSRWRLWKIFSETDIARMSEVEETSDIVLFMLEGLKGKSQPALDKLYRKYESEFPYQQEVERRFRLVMDKLEEQLGEIIVNTEFSRKILFQTLFVFYYEIMFGNDKTFIRKPPQSMPSKARSAVLEASNRIKSGSIPEDLAKFLRGSTASLIGRKTRLDFIKKVYKEQF